MAIRRCPYCKAIIDESQKFCNNCGTQLLFPQDDAIEEDIKGEKIRDDDFRDAEPDEEEPETEAGPAKPNDTRKEFDLGKILDGKASFPVSETEDESGTGPDASDKSLEEMDGFDERDAGEEDFILDETMGEEILADGDIDGKDEAVSAGEATSAVEVEKSAEAPDGAGESGASAPAAVAPSEDLDGDLDDEDREIAMEDGREEGADSALDDEDRDEAETREEIGRLIAALEKKHRKPPAPRASRKTPSSKTDTGGLPPWAEPSPTSELPAMGTAEEASAEIPGGSFVPGDTMDFEEEVMREAGLRPTRSTIGIPETLSKIELPGTLDQAPDEYGEDGAGSDPWGGRAGEESIRSMAEDRAAAGDDSVPRRKLGLLGILRAGICDLALVALFWFVAVLLAARILSLDVPTLVVRAAVPLALLFGVFLVAYLFLFLFFLGETLGARIAAPKR